MTDEKLIYTPKDPKLARTLEDLLQKITNIEEQTGTKFTIGGLTKGSVLFADKDGNVAEDNSNLFWDNTNKRLGIGTNTPGYDLHIAHGTTPRIMIEDTTNNVQLYGYASDTLAFLGTNSVHPFRLGANGAYAIHIDTSQQVGIGMNNPSRPLHVMGQIQLEHATTAPCLTLKSGYDTRYGYIEWRKSTNNQRGAYLGWGTPGTFFSLTLEDNNDFVIVGTDANRRMTIWNERNVTIGASAVDNTKMSCGLTIDQDAYDNEILAFKSSDIAHGMTNYAETDTYGRFGKIGSSTGGLYLVGLGESLYGQFFGCYVTTGNTSKTTSARAPFVIAAYKKSGTGSTFMGANENLFVILDSSNARFIVDKEGDVFRDGSCTEYQKYDDIALIKELEDCLSDKFTKKEKKEKDVYKKHEILYDDNFISLNKSSMLLYGAVRQLNEKILGLESRIGELEV